MFSGLASLQPLADSMNKTLLAQIQTWDAHLHDVEGIMVPSVSAFEVIFNNILTVAGGTAGLTCLIMLFVGGFKYLTASGDQKATAAAKATITWAIVGLLILIGGWFLLKFVSTLTGSQDILQFAVPTPEPITPTLTYPPTH